MGLIGSMRSLLKRSVLRSEILRRPAAAYCSSRDLLPQVLVNTSPDVLRELLFLPAGRYQTQLNQDLFALLVNRFRAGYFLEIGANDGFTLSNTLYLEEQFGWDGLLVEANPQYESSLKTRKAKSVTAAVVSQEGHYEFRAAGLYGGVAHLLDNLHERHIKGSNSITVWGTTLEQILIDNRVPTTVDFVSIDVEGAELSIVEQMCVLRDYRFVCGCIEHNRRQADYQRMESLLKGSGYRVVWEGQTGHDLFFVDQRASSSSG